MPQPQLISLDGLLRAARHTSTYVERTSSAFFVRPANTTQYAAADVVGDGRVLVFPNMASKNGGSGFIVKARMESNDVTTTAAIFRLYLYSAPPVAIADNAAKTKLWADRDKELGYIDFSLSTDGTGSDAAADTQTNVNLPFVAGADTTSIYGVLMAQAAYQPAGNSKSYLIQLTTESFE